MYRRKYDKEIVREFLEEKAMPWNSNSLVSKLKDITGYSERTIKIWLKDCREGKIRGVVYRRKGREAFYYAEKHKEAIEAKYKEELFVDIDKEETKRRVKEIQSYVKKKKNEIGEGLILAER